MNIIGKIYNYIIIIIKLYVINKDNKLNIIIPVRNRDKHLDMLIPALKKILTAQSIDALRFQRS